MVAPISRGDTTQWQVVDWAYEQAPHMTATQHSVLLYLTTHAFYTEANPEAGEVGQVLRQASYVDRICTGTSLKKDAVRRALVALQMAGYIQREVRVDRRVYGQQPHTIYVLWNEDAMREGIRNGTKRLPPELLAIPTRKSPEKKPGATLTVLKGYDENAKGYDENVL